MTQRMDYARAAPEIFRGMLGVEKALHSGGIEPRLLHMIKLRASQINGCAYCMDMHWKDAKAAGETEERLYMLNAWRESPLYSDRERAAMAWVEAVTNITVGHAPDDLYEATRAQFDEKQMAELTWAIASINAWNRIAISFRATPGIYQSTKA
ncbi:MAG: carboxymuconolactone decarboxylase family protein [Phycisphaerales bacterium]|nr:carboxymuconolactone decarboxylase family protein [Planctomycetota bacterium]